TASAGTLNIGTTTATTVQIGSSFLSGSQTINLGNNNTGTDTINVGGSASGSTTTIQGGTGIGAVGIQAGNGGTIAIGTTANAIVDIGSFGSSTATSTIH